MGDNKAFASLSSGLLARKGQARPAMRPQGFAPVTSPADDLGWNDMGHDVQRITGAVLPADLAGGSSLPPVTPLAVVPEVVRQRDVIAREFAASVDAEPVVVSLIEAEPEPARAIVIEAEAVEAEATDPMPAAPVGFVPARQSRRKSDRKAAPVVAMRPDSRKAAFTLRLDPDRHLLLRLACAVQHRSAQQIVIEALDRLLAELPDVARLAASLPRQD